jgi:glycosyltransferase involved in cell wall biosynthesis
MINQSLTHAHPPRSSPSFPLPHPSQQHDTPQQHDTTRRVTAGPIVSLNRFERKKNVGLALEAFAAVRQELLARGASSADKSGAQAMRLVVAGARRAV